MKTSTPIQTRSRSGFALFSFTLIACFVLLLSACKKEVDVVIPEPSVDIPTHPQAPVGAVTPVATPEGAAITATIGPAGGTLESADKRLRVVIPAGALTSNQAISVQPLNQNYCPLGTGQAFRLQPHGLTFAKPATLSFQYTQQDVNGSAAQLLRVAYQNDKGSWQSPATKGIDTTAHTVTVQTTHFSDWGLFHRMEVSPAEVIVNTEKEVRLRVLETPMNPYQEDELLVPIPSLVPSNYIERWSLYGEGVLVHKQNEGTYFTPKTMPADNPETVTVFLNQSTTIDGQVFNDLRLVSTIYVIPEGLTYRINGGKWVHTISSLGVQVLNSPAGKMLNMVSGVNTEGNNLGVAIQSLQVPVETSTPTSINPSTAIVMPWVVEGSGPMFNLSDARAQTIYKHFYQVGKVVYPSPGALTFYSFSKVGDYVIGKFNLQKSEAYNPLGSVGTFQIEGYFRIKRTL